MSTNLGRLTIFSDTKEDILFSYSVENNDAAMVNDAMNLLWLSTASGVNAIDLVTIVGQDLTLYQFQQKVEEMGGIFEIDAEGIAHIMFNMVDSGQSLFAYNIFIALIYEDTQEPTTYDEAVEAESQIEKDSENSYSSQSNTQD